MSTATSAGDGSNDSPSSMSPALTHDSHQDVVIRENGSTDTSSKAKAVNSVSKDQNLISGEWPTDTGNEVIFVDLKTPSPDTTKSEEDQATPKNGTNGTHKHLLNNLDDNKRVQNIKLVQSMTCGEDAKQVSVASVPVPISSKSKDGNCSADFDKMGLQEEHFKSNLGVNSNQDMTGPTETDSCIDITEENFVETPEENLPKLTDLSTKRRTLESLADKIVNKIHNLQSVVATRHVRQQLMVLVEHHHKVLNLMTKQTSSTSTATLYPSSLLDLNSLNNLSTSALVDLVQRMQSHVTSSKNSDQFKTKDKNSPAVAMTFSEKDSVQLAAGVMSRKLSELHADLDSDATASSSGGETDDEDVEYSGGSNAVEAEEQTDSNIL